MFTCRNNHPQLIMNEEDWPNGCPACETNDHTAIDKIYDKYKHLDAVLNMPEGQTVTDDDDPLHFAARDLWNAIKKSRADL